ncbi:MAG: hypothetical protein AAB527_01015 [Patescibacteria group bacterium]
MIKIVLKTFLWSAVSWLLLGVILFFGIGFYNGFVAQDSGVEVPRATLVVLRYAVLFLAVGIAAYIFIKEEKKYRETHIVVATESPAKILLKKEEVVPSIIKPQVIKPPEDFFSAKPSPAPEPFKPVPPTIPLPLPPKPAPAPFVPPKPEFIPPKPPITITPPPPPPISAPSSLPKSSDLKQGPDQIPWS